MRRIALVCVIAIGLGSLISPALAAQHDDDKKFSIEGEVRARWEYVQNVTDAEDSPAGFDDEYDFWPYRARIAAHGQFGKGVSGHVEVQNFGYFGNDGLPYNSTQDPVGQGFRLSIDDSEVDLYQGFIQMDDIGDTPWTVRVGRQEHTLGNELHLGDADFYNGISFDGVRAMGEYDHFDLDVFYYIVDEDESFPAIGDDDINLSGITAALEVGKDHSLEPYLLIYRDGDYSIGAGGGKIYSLGALWGRSVDSRKDIDDSRWDWSAEVTYQTGEFEPNGADLDIAAYVVEGWVGYNWKSGKDGHSRVHLGLFTASGDDNPADQDYEAFTPLFGDAHNRLGDLDLFGDPFGFFSVVGAFGVAGPTNITDLSLGWERHSGRHSYSATVHDLALTEDGGGEDAIGTELDLRYAFEYSKHLQLEAGLANLFAGDALDALVGGSADDIMRVLGQARLRF